MSVQMKIGGWNVTKDQLSNGSGVNTVGLKTRNFANITQGSKTSTYATIQSWVGLTDDTWSSITSFDGRIGDQILIAITVTDRDNQVGYMRCLVIDYDEEATIMTTNNLEFTIGYPKHVSIYAGDSEPNDAPFKVTNHGEVIATKGYIGDLEIADGGLRRKVDDYTKYSIKDDGITFNEDSTLSIGGANIFSQTDDDSIKRTHLTANGDPIIITSGYSENSSAIEMTNDSTGNTRETNYRCFYTLGIHPTYFKSYLSYAIKYKLVITVPKIVYDSIFSQSAISTRGLEPRIYFYDTRYNDYIYNTTKYKSISSRVDRGDGYYDIIYEDTSLTLRYGDREDISDYGTYELRFVLVELQGGQYVETSFKHVVCKISATFSFSSFIGKAQLVEYVKTSQGIKLYGLKYNNEYVHDGGLYNKYVYQDGYIYSCAESPGYGQIDLFQRIGYFGKLNVTSCTHNLGIESTDPSYINIDSVTTTPVIYYLNNSLITMKCPDLQGRCYEYADGCYPLFSYLTPGEINIKGSMYPKDDGQYNIGASMSRWNTIYATNGTIQTSFRGAKTDIESLDDRNDILFDSMIPRTYKFKKNESDRTHYGFILDEIRDAMDKAGISPKEFAAYTLVDPNDSSGDGGLRYTEFISLNTWQIQKLKARVSDLEEKLAKMEEALNELQSNKN